MLQDPLGQSVPLLDLDLDFDSSNLGKLDCVLNYVNEYLRISLLIEMHMHLPHRHVGRLSELHVELLLRRLHLVAVHDLVAGVIQLVLTHIRRLSNELVLSNVVQVY